MSKVQFTVPYQSLTRVLTGIKQVPLKSNLQSPVFGDVHFSMLGNGILTVHATDTILTVETSVPVNDSFGSGEMCLPSSDLDLITGMRGDVVEFDYESKQQLLDVCSGKEKAKIKGHKPEDYTRLSMSVTGKGHVVPFDVLKNIVERTHHSAGRSDANSEALKAISMDCSDSEITALSLDGHRVSAVFNEPVGDEAGEFRLLINAEHMRRMTQVIDVLANTKNVHIHIVGAKTYFVAGDVTVSITGTTGKFPDLEQLFTDDTLTYAVVDIKELNYVLDYVSDVRSNVVEFDFLPHTSEVLVSCWLDDDSDKGATSTLISEHEDSHMGQQNYSVLLLDHVKEQVKKYMGLKHDKLALMLGSKGFLIMKPMGVESDYAVFTPKGVKTRYASTTVL